MRKKDDMHIGHYIRLHRKILGITQLELANSCGVTSQCVSNWECYLRVPTRRHYAALCDVLDMPTEIYGSIYNNSIYKL